MENARCDTFRLHGKTSQKARALVLAARRCPRKPSTHVRLDEEEAVPAFVVVVE